MTSADYIATSTFLFPAEAGRHSTMIWTGTLGTTKPPQGTLPPATSWTGTAALVDLDMNKYTGTFNASFDGTFWEFSITDIASTSGATVNDLNWQEISYSTDTHKITGSNVYLLKGTVHGPNHESVAIAFDSLISRYVGTAVGHR